MLFFLLEKKKRKRSKCDQYFQEEDTLIEKEECSKYSSSGQWVKRVIYFNCKEKAKNVIFLFL